MSAFGNMMAVPTQLPADPGTPGLAAGQAPVAVAAAHPESLAAWGALAEQALDDARVVEGYAYARTGYHRGLDALRRSGWKGNGPIPWAHEPNRGFLRSLKALSVASAQLDDQVEADRCAAFLRDSDPAAVEALA